jgi:hypothetical protein
VLRPRQTLKLRAVDLARRAVPRAWRRPVKRIGWWGLRHRCPVCDARVRRYLPEGYEFPVLRELDVVGGERWPERTCPVCHANTRSRLLWWYLETVLRIRERRVRLLHLAPEPCIAWRLRALSSVSVHAADRDPSRYAFAGTLCQLDATALPYADACFDLILANHVLEHIDDDARALAELWRVLRPGGCAVLQVPIAQRLTHTLEDPRMRTPEQRERAYGQGDHVRLYGLDYAARLERAGFAVQKRTDHRQLDAEQKSRWLFNPREVLFLATRPG